MSTPPAMTKTTTSAATIRARVLLTRIPPSMCMGARHPPVTDGRLSEGGRSSPVEAGGDRAVDSYRLCRKLPCAQREDVCLAPEEITGAKSQGGQRRAQSRAQPPHGEGGDECDRQLAGGADQEKDGRRRDGPAAGDGLDRLLGGKAGELDGVQGGDEAHERRARVRLDPPSACHAARADDEQSPKQRQRGKAEPGLRDRREVRVRPTALDGLRGTPEAQRVGDQVTRLGA